MQNKIRDANNNQKGITGILDTIAALQWVGLQRVVSKTADLVDKRKESKVTQKAEEKPVEVTKEEAKLNRSKVDKAIRMINGERSIHTVSYV